MSLSVTTDVWCDRCGNWTTGVSSYKVEAKQARRNVAVIGWERIKVGYEFQDVCPTCLGKVECYRCNKWSKRQPGDDHLACPECRKKAG